VLKSSGYIKVLVVAEILTKNNLWNILYHKIMASLWHYVIRGRWSEASRAVLGRKCKQLQWQNVVVPIHQI